MQHLLTISPSPSPPPIYTQRRQGCAPEDKLLTAVKRLGKIDVTYEEAQSIRQSACLCYRDAHGYTSFLSNGSKAAKLGERLSADSKMLVRDGLEEQKAKCRRKPRAPQLCQQESCRKGSKNGSEGGATCKPPGAAPRAMAFPSRLGGLHWVGEGSQGGMESPHFCSNPEVSLLELRVALGWVWG